MTVEGDGKPRPPVMAPKLVIVISLYISRKDVKMTGNERVIKPKDSRSDERKIETEKSSFTIMNFLLPQELSSLVHP
jgi:hypothetical protein